MSWTEVKTDSGIEYMSVALSLDGSTVYAVERNAGEVHSLPFPGLTGSPTVVYTEPSGYEINGVTDTPDGPLVILDDASTFTTAEVRDFADNVIHTTAGTGSSRGFRLVWNPVGSRLYVLRATTGSGNHTLYSMLNDGSDVQTEFTSGAGIGLYSQRHGAMVTSDGAFWFTSATSGGRRATRIEPAGAEVFTGGASTVWGLAHVPGDTVDVFQSDGAGTNQVEYVSGFGLTETPVATAFDGYELIQSSVTADFLNGVAIAANPIPSPDDTIWFVFGGAAAPVRLRTGMRMHPT